MVRLEKHQARERRILAPLLPLQAILGVGLATLGLSPLRETLAETPTEVWYAATLASFIWIVWVVRAALGPSALILLAFITAAFLFNGGRAFAFLIGLEELPPLAPGLIGADESRAAIATLIVMQGVGLGAVMFAAYPRLLKKVEALGSERWAGTTSAVGVGMALVASVPAVLVLWRAGSVVVESGYMGLYQVDAPTSYNAALDRIAGFFVPGCLFALAGAKRNSVRKSIAVSGISIYACWLVFLGFRGWAILPVVSAATIWHYRFGRLSWRWVAFTAMVLLFVVFPLVPVVRTTSGFERYSLTSLRGAYETIENPARVMFLSMGSTAQTTALTQRLVPAFEDHRWGKTYLDSFARVFPNVIGGVHRAAAEGSLGHWITRYAYPEIAARGGGIGFSFIAEIYLNFGWLGLLPAGIVIGYLVAWMGKVALLGPLPLAAVSTFLSYFVFSVRGDSSVWMRPLFWYALAPVLLAVVLRQVGGPGFGPRQAKRANDGKTEGREFGEARAWLRAHNRVSGGPGD